jgi:photosystem II stability/assembly factor-like uncharacterized protein
MKRLVVVLCLALVAAAPALAAPARSAGKSTESRVNAGAFAGLKFRELGPALMSGRISDLAVHPKDKSTWFVAASYGGMWKTTNAGTTWTPLTGFGTSSMGCVTIDPTDPLVVWVGSGENNSQRSVGWGDGVYKSVDGGKNWTNVGLKASEHVGNILVDPRDGDVVFVAAQGPLWAAGGDRGVYKSTNGGTSWKRVLEVDEWTGANEVWFDPQNTDVMYASTYQRHRRVWTLINGGPGSGIWKSTDKGETWSRLKNGLPDEEMGRIGLAVSPAEPGVVYAIVEAAAGAGGFFRSTDSGANWEKMSSQMSTSPQYYNELFADPAQPGRVYLIDTYLQVTEDGGRTWRRAGERSKHVDNHVVWIDPDDNRHLLVGCDGGLYQSYDRGATWDYFPNLPITQFYKVEVDNSLPFYLVYGGTQDNNTQGGPSRTTNNHGIRNSDWFITLGGDGFQTRVDPTNPDIVYSQYQHAGLVRFDRKSGEAVDIQPQTEPGEPGPRWNWDSPLLISPHAHTRLYFASQRVYRSDDRGDSWTPVSGDLTRQIDRNRLPIMGRVWSVDAPSKNRSTSFYGNIVAFDESPLAEGLLAVGTDDGLVQVTEDGGRHWRRIESFPGVGEHPYVSRVLFSRHARNTLYATFDRHKMGDFKPYVLRSTDLGRTWTSVAGELPENGSVYALVEDHVKPELLFCGTEFGVFFTADGGRKWMAMKGGLPPMCVRDLAIQRRENDLVVGSFSRGFWVLDDYTALRTMVDEQRLAAEATLLPVRKTLLWVVDSPLGGGGRATQGERFYIASNPPYGATFTYHLGEGYQTLKEQRREREKKRIEKREDVFYPSWDSLRAEDREEEPSIVLTVTDDAGQVVRRLTGPAKKGFHRVTWDLAHEPLRPIELQPRQRSEFDDSYDSPLVTPGTYRVAMSKRVDGRETPLSEPRAFVVEPLANTTLPARDRGEVVAFHRRTADLQGAVLGATRALGEVGNRLRHLQRGVDQSPSAPAALRAEVRALNDRWRSLQQAFSGDATIRGREEPTPPTLVERVNQVAGGSWASTSNVTGTHRRNLELAAAEFRTALGELRALVAAVTGFEAKAEAAGVPWTPGRVPDWKP